MFRIRDFIAVSKGGNYSYGIIYEGLVVDYRVERTKFLEVDQVIITGQYDPKNKNPVVIFSPKIDSYHMDEKIIPITLKEVLQRICKLHSDQILAVKTDAPRETDTYVNRIELVGDPNLKEMPVVMVSTNKTFAQIYIPPIDRNPGE